MHATRKMGEFRPKDQAALTFISNELERKAATKMMMRGWRVLKCGWPDFMAVKGDRVVVVEVKPRGGRGDALERLRPMQTCVMNTLRALGIGCFMSDGDRSEKYDPALHGAVDFWDANYPSKVPERKIGGSGLYVDGLFIPSTAGAPTFRS